ncbi:hypothetical protein EES47_24895 [Streptomyces sp. ADI98-12]|nr:hypothetical protein EES47_24895 [Streptomyces sp. ADI98-12]
MGGPVLGGLFQDEVGVGAADAEGGDGGTAGPAGLGPGGGLGEQFHAAGRPVGVRGGRVDVEAPGQNAVAHGLHHLDDPGDAGSGLGVAGVGLQRAEQQRVRVTAVLPVRVEKGLRLDGVAQGGAGAVRLDGVDLARGEAGVDEGLTDQPLLGGTVGGGQAVGGAVLVDGGTPDDGEDLVAVALRVGEPLQQDQADALGPGGTVCRLGEGLAAAVGRQALLAGELREHLRRRHDGGAAGQRQRAFALPQRTDGQVQGDEGGGAGRVHRHGGALEAVRVRQAAGGDGDRVAGEQVPGDLFLAAARGAVVVAVSGADEDTGGAAREGVGEDAGALQRLPGGLQQEPLLRVHGQGLARRDPEERRVELTGVVEESALACVRGAVVGGVRVEQVVEVPAPVRGERGDGVHSVPGQFPQVLGGAHAAGVAAGHGDDGDRLAVAVLGVAELLPGLLEVGDGPLEICAEPVLVRHQVPTSP